MTNLYKAEIILNVKIYRLVFSGESEYDSRATDDEIHALLMRVNALWKCARIRWKLLSCQPQSVNPRESALLAAISEKHELRQLFGQISTFIPEVLRTRIWNICLLSRFPLRSGGVYVPETKTVFFAEESRWIRPNEVTLAHELGHMLGLQHVEFEANLMNQRSLRDLQSMMNSPAGLTLQPLDEDQIAIARAQAALGPY